MTFYGNLQSRAAALLTKFGRGVTLRKVAAGAYDTSTSSSVLTNTDSTLKAALFDFGTREVDGTLVQATDKRALVQAGAAVPEAQDKLLVDGVEYAILTVRESSPAGTPVLYELHLRA